MSFIDTLDFGKKACPIQAHYVAIDRRLGRRVFSVLIHQLSQFRLFGLPDPTIVDSFLLCDGSGSRRITTNDFLKLVEPITILCRDECTELSVFAQRARSKICTANYGLPISPTPKEVKLWVENPFGLEHELHALGLNEIL